MNAWYEESFGEDYLLVYKHRDMQGARREVEAMIGWLQLPPGAKVLDLCCGMGRHSLALRDSGYTVTGMDLSEVLLREARRADPDHTVEWVRGDMRDVPLAGPYDAVVNLFTSFGYFEEDEENARVMGEISRLLAPGGKYIVDFLNPGYVRGHLVPASSREDEGVRIDERRRISDGFVRKEITLTPPEGTPRVYRERVKLYERTDFERMAAAAGLAVDRTLGDYEASAYDRQASPRLILVGHKPA